jgi:ribulose kinase
VDTKGEPVTVSLSRNPCRNVVLWQDHRAIQEAEEINERGHGVLQFVGGRISPEMQPPKLLWLRRNLRRECWDRAGHFFDLADYLTFRATGATSRYVFTERSITLQGMG